MFSIRRRPCTLGCILGFLLFATTGRAQPLHWQSLAPNPAYTRDLALGASTVALNYAPQSQSINPAGLALLDTRTEFRGTLLLNPGGLWQITKYRADRSTAGRALDYGRLMVAGAAVQRRILTVAALLTQPVMGWDDRARYEDFDRSTPLDDYQNSLLLTLAVHPRVSIGGRMDRYYRYDTPMGDAFSYGVILRPRGVQVGVQYQRFPVSGARVWHPLDRRSGESTTAGVAITRENFALSVQVNNLTQSDQVAFLEPHAGVEWRPVRALALRAGGTQFSRSHRWAWTAGWGLLDFNWLRVRANRLRVPDDFLQGAVAVIYDERRPIQALASLTCVVRF